MKYTEKRHAENLINMLESTQSNYISITCPAEFYLNSIRKYYEMRNPSEYARREFFVAKEKVHELCANFIGLSFNDVPIGVGPCPCQQISCETAVKLTWLTLEEKGYI